MLVASAATALEDNGRSWSLSCPSFPSETVDSLWLQRPCDLVSRARQRCCAPMPLRPRRPSGKGPEESLAKTGHRSRGLGGQSQRGGWRWQVEGETERCGGQGREVGISIPKELGWKLAGLELKKMVYPELVM